MRAGIYARISKDDDGRGLGVQRQEEDCRQLATRLAWDVVEVFTDNDVSASSGKRRDAYERLLEALRGHQIDAVLAWHPDRLYRRMVDLERFITIIEATKARVATVTAGDIDLSTPSGRHVARILGSTAQAEAERTSERIRAKQRELALAGKDGGGTRPFGYERTPDGLKILPEERDIITKCAERILAGESVRTVAGDLNARGITTTRGKDWSIHTLRSMLVAPRLIAKRVHHGTLHPASWHPILDETTHSLLVHRLKENGTRRKRERAPQKYLLGKDLLRCGLCGAPMRSAPDRGRRVYRCHVQVPQNGCGRLVCDADQVEEYVRIAVLDALDGPGLQRQLEQRAGTDSKLRAILDEITQVEQRIEVVRNDFYVEARLDRAAYLKLDSELSARLEALRRQANHLADRKPLSELPTSGLEGWWQRSSLEKRRALVSTLIDRIEVGRHSLRNKAKPDLERYLIVWKG